MNLPRARETVVVQQDGEDFFVIDTENGEVFQINATAARILSLCREGATIAGAVAALSEGLDAADQEAEIHADVEATAAELVELGICEQA